MPRRERFFDYINLERISEWIIDWDIDIEWKMWYQIKELTNFNDDWIPEQLSLAYELLWRNGCWVVGWVKIFNDLAMWVAKRWAWKRSYQRLQ